MKATSEGLLLHLPTRPSTIAPTPMLPKPVPIQRAASSPQRFTAVEAGDAPTLRRYNGSVSVRIRVAPGDAGRRAIQLWGKTDEALAERAHILDDLAKRMLGFVDPNDIELALPTRLGPATRRHIAQCIRKVLSLAVYPGRHITVNPVPREWMPKVPKSAKKAKTCLFPDEEAKLLSCRAVLLERRLAYGILTREGMRASELGALRWSDVDLSRGRVRLDENKTDDPRAWALSPDVVRVLAWWKKQGSCEEGDRVLRGLDLTQGPRWLRGKIWAAKTRHKDELGDLRTAGVDRAELFERTKSRMPIRLHDLRATFVTVSLANGKTEQWVTDRTGHKSSQMLALYTRQARQWGELELGALQAMDTLLPEMAVREGKALEQEAPDSPETAAEPVDPPTSAEPVVVSERQERVVWADATSSAPRHPFAGPRDPSAGRSSRVRNGYAFAPTAGLEPATRRLTAACSTN